MASSLAVVAALFVGIGVFGVVLGLAMRARARREMLASLLEAELAEPSGTPEALTELMERTGKLAERMLRGTSLIGRLQLMLNRSGWSLRPGEFIAVVCAAAVGAGLFLLLLTSSPVWAVLGAAAAGSMFVSLVARKGRARSRRIEEQLPTVLQMLSGSLEAGSSVLHAMELIVEEGDPPLATEFARVVAETRVGRPLLESLEALAERIGSRDLDWTVEAIRIQHQTGGKLADTLRVLADFMRARLEVRGEVRALSAEARLSAKVLTAMPLFLAGFFFLFRRGYFEPLYATSMGRVMLVVGAAGLLVGSLWMRRLVRVEV
ncbi:MAG TPA: type II secretion system F family protein [Actinomycetota bacterium]|jgi:tight adherence protein B|nr:type II secretion system F family protein [Actinomycetota bacterium]